MTQSLIASLGAKWPDSAVLFDDWFDDGPSGWKQLFDSNVPRGVVGLSTEFALRHRSLTLTTTDQRNDGSLTTHPWSIATALKRTLRPHKTLDHVLYEAWWALRPTRGQAGMGNVQIEIDSDNNQGSRHFFRFRWVGTEPDKVLTVTTTNTSAIVTDAQSRFTPIDVGKAVTGTGIQANTTILSVDSAGQAHLSLPATASGTPQITLTGFFSSRFAISTDQSPYSEIVMFPSINTDLTTNPATVYSLPYNENKPMWVHVAMEVDINAGKYRGVKVGNLGAGSLADTPDNSLYVYSGVPSTLTGFTNGLNFAATVENRADADSSQTLFVGRARATATGATS